MPLAGWDSVTVPGAVSAWAALSERFGRLPFARLFDAAIGYAEHGFQVGPITALHWRQAQERFGQFPDFAAHFLPAPGPGEAFRRPELAAALGDIAATGGESFYRGALAERMAAAAAQAGGALRRTDLECHQADWVEPIGQIYRQVCLHELPPNGQGLAAQIALGILQHRQPGELDSPAAAHLEIEAMKIAARAACDHIADPAAMRLTPAALLGEESLARAAAGIGERAGRLPPATLPASQDTVCLAAADASGMMVSLIQSNYFGFGSGIVIPGTGIAMQNRGAGFVLEPGHPNQVGPAKRPFHTIIPGFVTSGAEPRLCFGLMGGHMQHQGHVQMVRRIFDHGQNPQAASDAPRWHVCPDFSLALERGFDPGAAADLAARGHQVRIEAEIAPFRRRPTYPEDWGWLHRRLRPSQGRAGRRVLKERRSLCKPPPRRARRTARHPWHRELRMAGPSQSRAYISMAGCMSEMHRESPRIARISTFPRCRTLGWEKSKP